MILDNIETSPWAMFFILLIAHLLVRQRVQKQKPGLAVNATRTRKMQVPKITSR
jgi:hypothetical protein